MIEHHLGFFEIAICQHQQGLDGLRHGTLVLVAGTAGLGDEHPGPELRLVQAQGGAGCLGHVTAGEVRDLECQVAFGEGHGHGQGAVDDELDRGLLDARQRGVPGHVVFDHVDRDRATQVVAVADGVLALPELLVVLPIAISGDDEVVPEVEQGFLGDDGRGDQVRRGSFLLM